MRRVMFPTAALLAALVALAVMGGPRPAAAQEPIPTRLLMPLFLPALRHDPPPPPPTATPAPTVTPAPTDPPPSGSIEWDPRLDLRMAHLIPASVRPGQGYWKLVKAVWFDLDDPRPMGVGDHDIAMNVQDAAGQRQLNVPVRITWEGGGEALFYMEAKPGEEYGGSYPMYHIAPTYRVEVVDSAPSDVIDGLGMGSLEDPSHKVHTSYGLTWRWTIAPDEQPSPTPTLTETPAVTDSPTTLPSLTPTVTPQPARSWDSRLDQLGTGLISASPAPGQGYWRLVRGVWYDAGQGPFATQSLILVDTLDESGARLPGVYVDVTTNDGWTWLASMMVEAKPGDPYGANFQMYELRPAYRVRPAGNAPADTVYNLGQGSITQPSVRSATRYGFTWQWTIAEQ